MGHASQLQTCALLERRIRAAAQEGKTVFHPEIRQLRSELRCACEAALFEDYPRAQVIMALISPTAGKATLVS